MKSLLATLVGATLLAAVPAHAATDVYLGISNVKGESTAKGYEGQIPVLAWSWGLSNAGSALDGPGKVTLQDLSWTQYLGPSAVALFGFLTSPSTTNQPGTATLSAVSTGEFGFNYFQAVFDRNLISSMSTGGSDGESQFTANFTMAMGQVTLRYRPTEAATWVEATFDQNNPGATVFSGNPVALQGLALALAPAVPSPVPEPASWALMLGGLLLTGAAWRRRQPH